MFRKKPIKPKIPFGSWRIVQQRHTQQYLVQQYRLAPFSLRTEYYWETMKAFPLLPDATIWLSREIGGDKELTYVPNDK